MAEKVKLSKDGSSIDFVQSDSIPTSPQKFRQSPEIEGFYRFTYENDLQKEAYEIMDRIINARKAKKAGAKKKPRPPPKKNPLNLLRRKIITPGLLSGRYSRNWMPIFIKS